MIPTGTTRSAGSGCSTTTSTPRPAGSAVVAPAPPWPVGSAGDVAKSLRKYQNLGITQFVLSDTPYRAEIERQGTSLLPMLRG